MCMFLLQESVQGIILPDRVGVVVGVIVGVSDSVGVAVNVGVLVGVGVLVEVGVGTGSNTNTTLIAAAIGNGVVLKASPSNTAILIASTSDCTRVA